MNFLMLKQQLDGEIAFPALVEKALVFFIRDCVMNNAAASNTILSRQVRVLYLCKQMRLVRIEDLWYTTLLMMVVVSPSHHRQICLLLERFFTKMGIDQSHYETLILQVFKTLENRRILFSLCDTILFYRWR